MHELSIATSLIELACEHAEQHGASRIRRIKIRLGVLSGLLRPLYFCFASTAKNTGCEGAILEIEEVPLTVMCPRCEEIKTPGSRYSFCCPVCGTPTPEVVTGREMQLVALEFEAGDFRAESEPVCDRGRQPARDALRRKDSHQHSIGRQHE